MAQDKKKEILQIAIDKVQMSDAWIKRSDKANDYCCPSIGKDSVLYPSLYLNSRQAPELKWCETWEEITLVIKSKVVSHSVDDNLNSTNGKRETWSLDIHKIGVIKK